MDVVRLCVIGCGRAGMVHARNLSGRVPHAELVAVCDSVKDVAIRAAKELNIKKYYTDYREVMNDNEIDAVIIASPTKYHKEICVTAAKSKKHIFCEKPLAMNVKECEEIIQACEENNVKLQVGFMRRFMKDFIKAKEILDSGEIGDIVLVKSLTRGPSKPKEWMMDIKKSNGLLAEVNSHDIDTVRWLTGSDIKTVFALGGNYRNVEFKEKYPDFYDNVVMIFELENGAQGVIDGAMYVQYGYDARVEILGTKGVIFVGQNNDTSVVACTKTHGVKRPLMSSWMVLFEDAYYEEDKSFVQSILNDDPPLVTGIDGLKAVEVVEAGNQSLIEKRIVHL